MVRLYDVLCLVRRNFAMSALLCIGEEFITIQRSLSPKNSDLAQGIHMVSWAIHT